MAETCRNLCFFFIVSFLVFLSYSLTVQAYSNFTVGGSLGWFDNLQKPNINYQKWATGKNFSLGDFLIFNTDSNHSVIQTYNFTTYKRCNYNEAEEDDTTEWSSADPSTDAQAVTVPVPLLKEGPTYFFSGNYDGEQCKHGQKFKINVTHGQGLPESLKNPAPDAPAPANDDDNSAPDTVVPSNFNNPVGSDEVKQTSGSRGSTVFWKGFVGFFSVFLGFFVFVELGGGDWGHGFVLW